MFLADDRILSMRAIIAEVSTDIRQHHFSLKARAGWSEEQRRRYSLFQLGTSMVWPGFLSSASGVVKNRKLKSALRLNAACEVGASEGSTGHSMLARQFCLSQGLTLEDVGSWAWNPVNHAMVADMCSILGESDAFISGRFLAGESFAAVMFEVFQPAFTQIPGCDTTYMSEHVEVDTEEHSRLLMEAVEDVLATGGNYEEVIRGILAGAKVRMEYLTYFETGEMG